MLTMMEGLCWNWGIKSATFFALYLVALHVSFIKNLMENLSIPFEVAKFVLQNK